MRLPFDSRQRPDLARASGQLLSEARIEARRLGHPFVAPEHLLLALLARSESEPARILSAMGLKLGYVRDQVQAAFSTEVRRKLPAGDLPETSRAKAVLEAAMTMAAVAGLPDGRIDPTHLLLSIMAESRCVAAQTLRRLGATPEGVRSMVARIPPLRASFQIEIDDKADRLIYEQIITQIMGAAATGRISPGERLPTVRQLADDLDVAPGTVARAYGELEQSGVIVTEGARGTFLAQPRHPPASGEQRSNTLRELLRPVVVTAYHFGATANDVRMALERAMMDIFPDAA